jgi:hypothetical protein
VVLAKKQTERRNQTMAAARSRSIRLPEDMWDALETEATSKERSVNWIVGRIIRDHLAGKSKGRNKGGDT